VVGSLITATDHNDSDAWLEVSKNDEGEEMEEEEEQENNGKRERSQGISFQTHRSYHTPSLTNSLGKPNLQ